ncbi:30S ribosomal protein S6 [Candidatus Nomurabacteria bacterium]|nr:30S ribosomal protein S6 [Candidatus Nomurabacteria bacterium]
MRFMSATENNNEIKDGNEIEKDANSRVYELAYLLVPTLSEEDVPVSYGNLKEMVSSFGGAVISNEMPKMIPLAYSMAKVISNLRNKFNTAYFGWIKFMMDSDKVLELKKKLDLDITVIRFLILKTVKENTIAAKRFVRPDMHRKPKFAKEGTDEPAVPINKEEIDKEIDAMVAV